MTERSDRRKRRRCGLALAVAMLPFVVCPAVLATTHPVELHDGDVLGPDNWQAATGLLPEEILDHYRKGEYRNAVMDITKPGILSIQNPPDFQAATRANRGRFTLSPDGSIVERQTGKQPRFIMGLPFPDIDPKDPEAGRKIVWNYFYSVWYKGDGHFLNELVMLGREGIERRIKTEVKIRMYDGAPEARNRPNPENLLSQMLATVVGPADLAGIVSLTWRYRDPKKPDSLWTYVPGLRRVRQVDPLNRSDGFMGSDLSIDDGPFFDGKPEDFEFKLLGKHEQLVLMDPFSLRGQADLRPVPGGGWRIVWKDVPRIGADDPHWGGLPWAPVSDVLVRRPVWVVEAVPKDPNYLYGRLLLRIDAETYRGSWASKYDRGGSLLVTYQVSTGAYTSPDGGKTWISAGGTAVQTAENFLYDRATVVLFPPRNPRNPADYRIDLPARLFSFTTLMHVGK